MTSDEFQRRWTELNELGVKEMRELRQRIAELTRERDDWKGIASDWKTKIYELTTALQKVVKERDEAEALVGEHAQRIAALTAEVDERERERDEARDTIQRWRGVCIKAHDSFGELQDLKALCREARLRLLKLDDVFDKGDLRERLRKAGGDDGPGSV